MKPNNFILSIVKLLRDAGIVFVISAFIMTLYLVSMNSFVESMSYNLYLFFGFLVLSISLVSGFLSVIYFSRDGYK